MNTLEKMAVSILLKESVVLADKIVDTHRQNVNLSRQALEKIIFLFGEHKLYKEEGDEWNDEHPVWFSARIGTQTYDGILTGFKNRYLTFANAASDELVCAPSDVSGSDLYFILQRITKSLSQSMSDEN